MVYDPIIDEIHKYRREFARKFNYDLKAMVDDLMKRQKESGRKVVDLSGRAKKKPATQDKKE